MISECETYFRHYNYGMSYKSLLYLDDFPSAANKNFTRLELLRAIACNYMTYIQLFYILTNLLYVHNIQTLEVFYI